MAGLAIESAALVGVLAVGQVALLAQDHSELLREADARDVAEIGRHLGFVGGHGRERLGRQPLAGLRRDVPVALQLLEEGAVVGRVAGHGHAGEVARRPR